MQVVFRHLLPGDGEDREVCADGAERCDGDEAQGEAAAVGPDPQA